MYSDDVSSAFGPIAQFQRFGASRRRYERLSRVLLLMGALGLMLVLGVAPASAQQGAGGATRSAPASMPAPKDICVYRAADYRAGTRVLPLPEKGGLPFSREGGSGNAQAATAEISINFNGGFPDAARQALRAAADVWEAHLRSPVAIEIDAFWEPLGSEDALANAGPTVLFANFANAPQTGVFYAVALANARANQDLNEGDAEISARFNSARDDWFFGRGDPGPRQIDFTSVAVHEIAHGLGFFGSMTVEGDEGSWGLSGEGTPAAVPAGYETFAEGLGGNRLIDTNFYPNPSERLADTLQSDSVFFNGPRARIGAGGGERPELYAPSEWNQGSSFSHLDEGTYPAGDVNSLMSPFVGFEEVIRTPGGIVCGIFDDMGWPLGPGCETLLFNDLIAFEAAFLTETESTVELNWAVAGNSEVTTVEVQQAGVGEPFQTIRTVGIGEGGLCETGPEDNVACTLRLDDLRPGAYRFQLVLVEEGGTRTPSAVRQALVEPQGAVLVESYPNPFGQRATVRVVLQNEQRVAINLYDALGRLIRQLLDEEVMGERRVALQAGALASGVYFVRVVGEDFTETEEMVLVR